MTQNVNDSDSLLSPKYNDYKILKIVIVQILNENLVFRLTVWYIGVVNLREKFPPGPRFVPESFPLFAFLTCCAILPTSLEVRDPI